ncbi:MAG: hypothetical protein AAB320_04855 [Elusimicrobiota bacterium]
MKVFKTLGFCALAASLAFSAYELKQVSKLAAEFKSGKLAPEQLFQKLAAEDKTGAMAKLLEGQQAALARMDQASLGPEGAPPVSSASPAPPPGQSFEDPPGPSHRDFGGSSRGGRTLSSGKGLMVDSSGRRFEASPEGRKAPAVAVLPPKPLALPSMSLALPELPKALTGAPGDLESRKRRAYALLLGTVALAAAGLIVARRAMKG